MEKIELIEIPLDGSLTILPHPKQAELYGEEIIDDDFLESVRLQGVLQPPVITYLKDIADGMLEFIDPATDPNAIVIVSGHRRWKASEKVGKTSMHCQLKRYENYFDSEVEHITYNKQRKKKPSQIAAEINAYKQKLSQVRKDLEDNGVSALEKYKSFSFGEHLQVDENGRYYLPFAREMIKSQLGHSETLQKQLGVIQDEDWEQDRIERISISALSESKKKKAIEQFSKLLADARIEVDKKDGLSINKVYTEIMRVWNDIDSIINPKPKEKKSKKKTEVTKKWLKAHDFSCVANLDQLERVKDNVTLTEEKEWIHIDDGKGKHYLINVELLIKFLKEQKI